VKSLKAKKKLYEVTFLLETGKEISNTVSEDLVVEYRLVRDKELTPELFNRFTEDALLDNITQKAKRFALGKLHSDKEIFAYLEASGADWDTQLKIIAKLRKLGLPEEGTRLDSLFDLAFHAKREGPEKLRFELLTRGFSAELVKALLENADQGEIEDNLQHLFDKKLPKLKKTSLRSAEREMKRHLYTKGYSFAAVENYVNGRSKDFLELIDETGIIKKDYAALDKRYRRQGLTGEKLRLKLIQALERKGYGYGLIKSTIEGSE